MSDSLPLHPLIVHLPLALAVLLPFLAAGAILSWWRGWLPGRRAWTVVVVLQALLTVSAWAALRTGEAEEERVEGTIAESVLESHEEAAKAFLGATAGVLVMTVLAFSIPGERVPRLVAALALAGMVIGTFLAVRVGRAGGELVYRHGAATAYAAPAAPLPSGLLTDREGQDDDD
jgi:uncharacterized membrane protein